MDRFGGMIFGAVRGMVVVTVVVILAGLTPLPKDSWWTESTVIPPFQLLAVWLRDHLSSVWRNTSVIASFFQKIQVKK